MQNLINNMLSSILDDPVNTGANIVGANISAQALEIAKKQVELAKNALVLATKNNNFQLEVRTLLEQILKEVKWLNENLSKK